MHIWEKWPISCNSGLTSVSMSYFSFYSWVCDRFCSNNAVSCPFPESSRCRAQRKPDNLLLTRHYYFHAGPVTQSPSGSGKRRQEAWGAALRAQTRETGFTVLHFWSEKDFWVGKQDFTLMIFFFPAKYLKGHIAISIRMFLTTQVSVKSKSSAMKETRAFLFFCFFWRPG